MGKQSKQQLRILKSKLQPNTKQSISKPQYDAIRPEPTIISKHVIPATKLICIWKPIMLWQPSNRNGINGVSRPVNTSSNYTVNAIDVNVINDATKLYAKLGF